MLPGLRILFATTILAISILVFGLGAAALLRAAHEEFASLTLWRPAQQPVLTPFTPQVPRLETTPVLAMLRIEVGDQCYVEFAGGEIIFSLPNGLQAYMLTDQKGNRLNEGPINIVQDESQKDFLVRNGVSCMGCHSSGMIKVNDDIRFKLDEGMPGVNFDDITKDQIRDLYPRREDFDDLQQEDVDRFNGGRMSGWRVSRRANADARALRARAVNAPQAERNAPLTCASPLPINCGTPSRSSMFSLA